MSRNAKKPIRRHYIDTPFELSEYEGDVNDRSTEFWCRRCDVPAIVHIDPRDGEVDAIGCPVFGADHFHVAYILAEEDTPEAECRRLGDLEDDEWDLELEYYLVDGPFRFPLGSDKGPPPEFEN